MSIFMRGKHWQVGKVLGQILAEWFENVVNPVGNGTKGFLAADDKTGRGAVRCYWLQVVAKLRSQRE